MGKSLCRLCLHKNNHNVMTNVFELSSMYSDISIPNLLYWSFGIEIHPDDSFTKLVCNKCVNVIIKVIKIRKFFRTNQTILKEKQCPNDYVVQPGWYNTKEIGTNVNFTQENYVNISLDILKNFNRPSIPICKLEDSSKIKQEYTRVGNIWYRKRKHKNAKVQAEMVNTKLNLTDETEQKNAKKRKLNGYCVENKELGNLNVKNKLLNLYRHNDPETTTNKIKNDTYVSVPEQIFEQFSRPYIDLETIEISKTVCSEYEKISDYVYKKIKQNNPPTTSPSFTICEYTKTHQQNYFYTMETSQQKPLMGQQTNTAQVMKKSFSNKNQKPLLQINNVLQVNACKYCHEIFEDQHFLKSLL